MIYTNYDTWFTLLGNPQVYGDLGLWLGAMNGADWCPTYSFGAWTGWSYMQYAIKNLGGVDVDVDELNIS